MNSQPKINLFVIISIVSFQILFGYDGCDNLEYKSWYNDDSWIVVRDVVGVCTTGIYTGIWGDYVKSEYIECLSDGSDVLYSYYDNSDCSGIAENSKLGSVKIASDDGKSDYVVNCVGIPCEYGLQRIYETESCNQTNVTNILYEDYSIEALGACEFFHGTTYRQYTKCVDNKELIWSTYSNTECLNSTIVSTHDNANECDSDQKQTRIFCGTADITSYDGSLPTTSEPTASPIPTTAPPTILPTAYPTLQPISGCFPINECQASVDSNGISSSSDFRCQSGQKVQYFYNDTGCDVLTETLVLDEEPIDCSGNCTNYVTVKQYNDVDGCTQDQGYSEYSTPLGCVNNDWGSYYTACTDTSIYTVLYGGFDCIGDISMEWEQENGCHTATTDSFEWNYYMEVLYCGSSLTTTTPPTALPTYGCFPINECDASVDTTGLSSSSEFGCQSGQKVQYSYDDTECDVLTETLVLDESNFWADEEQIDCSGTCTNYVTVKTYNDGDGCTQDLGYFEHSTALGCMNGAWGNSYYTTCTDTSVYTITYEGLNCIGDISMEFEQENGCHIVTAGSFEWNSYIEVLYCGESPLTTTASPTPPTVFPTYGPITTEPTITPSTTTTQTAEPTYVECINTFELFDDDLWFSMAYDEESEVMSITLTGPDDRWFGIGFGSNEMNGTYAITVCGEGTSPFDINERILGYHNEGTILSSYEETSVDDNTRTIKLYRDWSVDSNGIYDFTDYFECNIDNMNIIWAIGSDNTLDIHQKSGTQTLKCGCNGVQSTWTPFGEIDTSITQVDVSNDVAGYRIKYLFTFFIFISFLAN